MIPDPEKRIKDDIKQANKNIKYKQSEVEKLKDHKFWLIKKLKESKKQALIRRFEELVLERIWEVRSIHQQYPLYNAQSPGECCISLATRGNKELFYLMDRLSEVRGEKTKYGVRKQNNFIILNFENVGQLARLSADGLRVHTKDFITSPFFFILHMR